MREDLLQYLWQFQQFDKKNLVTAEGKSLKIIKTGMHNTDSGPDFLQAQLLIDGTTLHGHVELHVRAQAWYMHNHHKDEAYDNVILHVVWHNDKPVLRKDGNPLPTLILKKYTKIDLLDRYNMLTKSQSSLPCASQLNSVAKKKWYSMLEKTVLQRLSHKYNLVYQLFETNKNNSEATAYQLLAYNFGFKINSATFLQLSKLVPHKLIQKNAPSWISLEALLLGQAGLLSSKKEIKNDYLDKLIQTYSYLKHKYKLTTTLTTSQWKFSRLRPANSPYIRITQFASLLYHHRSLFYLLINSPVQDLYRALAIKQSSYWQMHYQLAKKSKKPMAGLGKSSINNIIINTVVPMLVAYGKLRNTELYTNRAIAMLRNLPAEQNIITKKWQKLHMPIQNAFASQGSLELYHKYCSLQKCLQCDIGKTLLGKSIR